MKINLLGYTATDDLWKVRGAAPKAGYTATDDLWK